MAKQLLAVGVEGQCLIEEKKRESADLRAKGNGSTNGIWPLIDDCLANPTAELTSIRVDRHIPTHTSPIQHSADFSLYNLPKMAAYAVQHGGPVLRPDQMERSIRQSVPEVCHQAKGNGSTAITKFTNHLPVHFQLQLPRRIVPISSTEDLSLKLQNASPVWSLLNASNWHSYWPYRYLSDPNSHEMFWHDPHSLHSPLHRKDLFGKNKPKVDYIANQHFWTHPYPHWARYRGYLYDYANPSFYSKEFDLNYFEI